MFLTAEGALIRDHALVLAVVVRTGPNKSLDASGGSVSLNLHGVAKGLIRPVEIVRLISRGQLNRYTALEAAGLELWSSAEIKFS